MTFVRFINKSRSVNISFYSILRIHSWHIKHLMYPADDSIPSVNWRIPQTDRVRRIQLPDIDPNDPGRTSHSTPTMTLSELRQVGYSTCDKSHESESLYKSEGYPRGQLSRTDTAVANPAVWLFGQIQRRTTISCGPAAELGCDGGVVWTQMSYESRSWDYIGGWNDTRDDYRSSTSAAAAAAAAAAARAAAAAGGSRSFGIRQGT